MKTYIKFITYTYLRSFVNIFLIMLGLVFILNLLSELDFFKNLDVDTLIPLYLSILNSGSLIFEFIIKILSSILSLIHNPFSVMTAKYLLSLVYVDFLSK